MSYFMKEENYLEHHGIRGQKWGIRRFQNKDGTLTAAGKKRKTEEDDVQTKKKQTEGNDSQARKGLSKGQKAAIAIGATAVAAGLAAYGGHKLNEAVKSVNKDIDNRVVKKLISENLGRAHNIRLEAMQRNSEHGNRIVDSMRVNEGLFKKGERKESEYKMLDKHFNDELDSLRKMADSDFKYADRLVSKRDFSNDEKLSKSREAINDLLKERKGNTPKNSDLALEYLYRRSLNKKGR